MHRLFLSLVSLIFVASIACTSGAPSPVPGSPGVTEAPLVSPTAVAEASATATPGEFFLLVTSPQDESLAYSSPLELQGSTAVDAVVTVNGQVVEVGPQGEFTSSVGLEEGPNLIEVIASDFAGHEQALVLSVIYIP
jgi:hypothetical protein